MKYEIKNRFVGWVKGGGVMTRISEILFLVLLFAIGFMVMVVDTSPLEKTLTMIGG